MTHLLWTDGQKKWLKDHLGILDGYARMTSLVPMRETLRREIGILQEVQRAIESNKSLLGPRLAVWEWWAYWYSAAWLATKFSPSSTHAQQLEDSHVFRMTILIERDIRLAALAQPHINTRHKDAS